MGELSDCRILLVDDVAANVDVLAQALHGDYLLSYALSGEAALKSVARRVPDLVLLDVVMPDLDGYEVCRRLREDPATRDVPVMFLSALDEAWNKAKAFEAGGTDYVAKPFDMLEVQARVRSLLRAKRYQDALREQRASELRIAREIEMSLVPRTFAPPAGCSDFELYGFLEPAQEVGGDLYLPARRAGGAARGLSRWARAAAAWHHGAGHASIPARHEIVIRESTRRHGIGVFA